MIMFYQYLFLWLCRNIPYYYDILFFNTLKTIPQLRSHGMVENVLIWCMRYYGFSSIFFIGTKSTWWILNPSMDTISLNFLYLLRHRIYPWSTPPPPYQFLNPSSNFNYFLIQVNYLLTFIVIHRGIAVLMLMESKRWSNAKVVL